MELRREDKLLLKCLTAEPVEGSVSMLGHLTPKDWDPIVEQSMKHVVTPLLYQQVKRFGPSLPVPPNVLKRLREIYLINAARNMRLHHELSNVLKMFNDEGILTGISFSGAAKAFNLPFVAGQTVAYGLSKEDALSMITINNARILGIDDRTGSLEAGKDANIIVSTGDILDMMTNNIELAYINGRTIVLDDKFKMLYRRFQEKYERNE